MSSPQKIFVSIVLVIVIVGAIAGGYVYPKLSPSFGASPAGSTFGESKQAAVSMAPLTAGATSTSILNTDGQPRWIADFGFAGCTGIGTSYTYPNTNATGLSALLIQAATTSIANEGLQGNTNYALNMTVSTSSSIYTASASSTNPSNAGFWDAGTYMTFTFNATSTGNCVVEVDYIPS